MSVWILHQPGLEGDEPYIAMPWQGIPNLSAIGTQAELRQLIARLQPDAPPETVSLRTQVLWKGLSELHKEDLIAVPKIALGDVAFAEVIGGYEYQPAMVGRAARHVYPVRWFVKKTPIKHFGKDVPLLTDESVPLWQVENPKLRTLIRDQVPLGYNRFRKLKWLLALAFILHLIRFFWGKIDGTF